MTPTEIAADVAKRIRTADQEAADATAAYAAGRFGEWWAKRMAAVAKRMEADADAAISNAASD